MSPRLSGRKLRINPKSGAPVSGEGQTLGKPAGQPLGSGGPAYVGLTRSPPNALVPLST
jgi:hypothetical protein